MDKPKPEPTPFPKTFFEAVGTLLAIIVFLFAVAVIIFLGVGFLLGFFEFIEFCGKFWTNFYK